MTKEKGRLALLLYIDEGISREVHGTSRMSLDPESLGFINQRTDKLLKEHDDALYEGLVEGLAKELAKLYYRKDEVFWPAFTEIAKNEWRKKARAAIKASREGKP